MPGLKASCITFWSPVAAPPDSYSVVGYSGPGDGGGSPGSIPGQQGGGGRAWGVGVSPDADRAVRSGTGGLY